jgi:thiamine biosynthesis protein ThiI
MIEDVIIIHLHELTLKGKNRSWFENILINNLKKHLYKLPYQAIKIVSGRILVTSISRELWEEYRDILKCVIGIRNFILTKRVPLEIEDIKEEALLACQSLDIKGSFRISARRQNKNFKYNTSQINIIVGEFVQKNTGLSVNLGAPDINIIIEIVNNDVFIGVHKINAYGGLPVGTSETALSLISSGIDSPVASFNMIKRGIKLDYIHFHSAPTTSKQSVYNVISILKVLSQYQLDSKLYLFPLLDIQNKIMDEVDSKYWIILFRRAMINIASKVAIKNNYKVLISGENIGQVASQTLSNIVAVQNASDLPIIRPLAGYNKEDIVNQAQDIGTYDISIEPYEDCCSYFVPPNPETKAHLIRIQNIENKIDLNNLINSNLTKIEMEEITYE